MSYFLMARNRKIERRFIRFKRIKDRFRILCILIFMTGYLRVHNLLKALQFFSIRPEYSGVNPLFIPARRRRALDHVKSAF